MYISLSKFRMILDTLKRSNNLQKLSRIEYSDWRELVEISQNECPRCSEDFCDGDDDIDFEIDNDLTVKFTCHMCSRNVTSVTNKLFARIMRNRPMDSTGVERIIIEYNKSKEVQERQRINKEIENKKQELDVLALATRREETIVGTSDRMVAMGMNGKQILKGEEENNNMMNTNKMFKGLDFGKANKDLYRLSHLGLAIKNAEGTFVSYDKSNKELIDVDLFDFDLDGMIYKMPVAHNQVVVGDVIVHNGKSMLVQEIKGSNLEVVDPSAGEIKTIMPTKNMFGFNFFTKILCLMDMSNLGASNDNPFGNMMPMLMMSAMGEGKGNSDMMTMMMMSQMMGGNTQMGDMFSNPMMMMAMMSGDGKMGDMLPMMMMIQGGNMFAPQKQIVSQEANTQDAE